jgi:hypothetical protein
LRLHLFLAVVWLLFGAIFFALPWVVPHAPRFTLVGTEISPGWLGIALAVYNLLRWWATRVGRSPRRSIRDEVYHRRRASSEPAPPPHPEFDFTRPPPEKETSG